MKRYFFISFWVLTVFSGFGSVKDLKEIEISNELISMDIRKDNCLIHTALKYLSLIYT